MNYKEGFYVLIIHFTARTVLHRILHLDIRRKYHVLPRPSSLILVLLLVLPVLISAGLFRDFNNAFRLSVSRKKEFTHLELLRAIEAVNLAIKALWASGIFHTIFGIIHVFVTMSGEQRLRATTISMITLLYAAFFVILLLPMRSRLLVQLHELPE